MKDALDRLILDLGRASGSAVVGALDEENAQKLAWSEFGTLTAPPRPTLSVTTDRLQRPIERAIDKRLRAVLDGKDHHSTGQEILADVGRDLAEEVQNAIDGNTPPPLAASTLAARRRAGQGDRTLVATDEMRKSITVKASARVDGVDEEAEG